jgi:predicted RNA binding protein with dsRBD fold (UPF0201 family)
MRLMVRARVYPTEDEEKVMEAIRNLFDVAVGVEGEHLVGLGEERASLNRFYTLLRSQGILDSAREVFLKKTEGNQLSFRLNKQAACAGAVNFDGNSYLGSIRVTITASSIAELIDWLAPGTG